MNNVLFGIDFKVFSLQKSSNSQFTLLKCFSSVFQVYKDYAHIFPVLSPGAISDVVFYLDIMDLHIYSLATLVPLCVFYATMREVYWGLAYNEAFC